MRSMRRPARSISVTLASRAGSVRNVRCRRLAWARITVSGVPTSCVSVSMKSTKRWVPASSRNAAHATNRRLVAAKTVDSAISAVTMRQASPYTTD